MMFSREGKLKYAETRRLIRQAMVEKRLVLFVGSGTSLDSGMPTWREAIDIIAKRTGVDPKEADSLIVPQYYFNARGGKEYTQLMREIFKYGKKLETRLVHKNIMRFDADTIITTNYDHLLETAAEENGIFMDVVARDADLPYRKAGKELIKMHGDFDHDNFVLKEDDYLQYHRNFKLIENYIKSLIGTKTILFIGYSLSDPDVKQIFTWVKDVLGEDFQRAYLINAGDKFNENVYEYFKHLGVNLIYATELLEESASNLTNNTNETLEYLLQDDKEDKSTTEYVYNELKPFVDMNYTFRKYATKAILSKPNNQMYVQDGVITCSKDKSKTDEKDFAKGIAAAIEGETVSEQYASIYKALKQSGLKGVIAEDDNGKMQVYDFIHDEPEEYEKDIFEFDYTKLEAIKKENLVKLSEETPLLYMKQAAICCFTHDYSSAYYCLNHAARAFYKKDQFAWYFIAQWNKLHVGQVIRQIDVWNTDTKLIGEIEDDLKAINIEKTLQSIPDLGNKNNSFLKDLIDFHFSTDIFYNTYRASRDIDAESKKTYMIHTALPAYDKLREMILDYYMYCTKNYLLVDAYPKNNEIYNMFVRSLFSSLAAPDIEQENGGFPFNAQNYHLKELKPEDIHYTIRYTDSTTLINLLKEYDVTAINLSDAAKDYIHKLVSNLRSLEDIPEERWKISTISRILVLLSRILLDPDIVNKVINVLHGFEGTEFLWELRKEMTMFFQAVYDQKIYHDKSVYNQIIRIIDKMLKQFCESGRIQNMWGPVVSLINCCHAAGKPYSNCEQMMDILVNHRTFAVELFPALSESVQKVIKEFFSGTEGKAYITSDYLYGLLVLYGIMDADEELEKKAIDRIIDDEKKKEQGIYAFSPTNILRILGNLYINEKIINKERFVKTVNRAHDEFVKWFIDQKEYDYTLFKLEWLEEIREDVLKDLASDKEVAEKIKVKYFGEYCSGRVPKGITDKMIKYFFNDGYCRTDEILNTGANPE